MAVAESAGEPLDLLIDGVPSGAAGMVITATLRILANRQWPRTAGGGSGRTSRPGRNRGRSTRAIRLGPRRRRCRAAFGIVADLGGAQVLAVLDDGQLELVELQFRDLAKGLFQRLPREAECATGDEHRPLLSSPSADGTRFLQPQPCRHHGTAGRTPLESGKDGSLRPRSDLTAACGQAIGQKPPAGRARAGLGSPESSRRARPDRLAASDAGMRAQCELGQAGELGVVLRAIGLQGRQERPLGIEPHGLGGGLADHAKVVDPERARRRSSRTAAGPNRARRPAGRRRGPPWLPTPPRTANSVAAQVGLPAGLALDPDADPGISRGRRKKAWMIMLEALLGTKSPLIADAGGAAAVSLRLPWPEWGLDGSMAIVHLGPPSSRHPPATKLDSAEEADCGSVVRVC